MMHPPLLGRMFSLRVHPEGWFFVRWALFLTAISCLSPLPYLWVLGVLGIAGILLFFRNPGRVTFVKPGVIVAPADGVIVECGPGEPPQELELPQQSWQKIAIFLSPFDVHVNRIPCQGTVDQKFYRPGSFSHVVTAETPVHNERLSLVIHTGDSMEPRVGGTEEERSESDHKTPANIARRRGGHTVVCTQIAGFMARRIVCYQKEGDQVQPGQEYGLICFGSRVDLYVPDNTDLAVTQGQYVRGGETWIGFLPDTAAVDAKA
jgi:phosphatidylserine decarboxylase